MTIFEFLRNQAFWIMDLLRGAQVKKAYDLLDNCESGKWTESEIAEYQEKQLTFLLQHVKTTVPYYMEKPYSDISNWPVVSKTIIKDNQDKFISTRYKKEDLIVMSTSGSTGTPFRCYQNIEKKRHVNAEVLYYNGQTGYKIGRRIIYLRSVVQEISKSAISQFAQNIYLLNCTDLSDTGIETKLKFIKKYTKGCGAMMMGYSSTLDAFRKYFDKYGFDKAKGCNLYGVIGGSTMLYDNTRNAIEKAFNCKCFSRYANEENGFLGQDGVKNNVFFMNRANYYVEILKLDSDEAAEIGEIGRIVVTDLYNYAMPMLRYDTGDVGAWEKIEYNGTERMAIGNFGGRVVDMIFNCNGETISPHSISTAMWKYQNVEQYQFAQIGKGIYEIRLNIVSNTKIDEEELKSNLKVIVGDGATIVVKYVNEIPVLASGKRRYVVNEYTNELF